jgi:hypothetical protein
MSQESGQAGAEDVQTVAALLIEEFGAYSCYELPEMPESQARLIAARIIKILQYHIDCSQIPGDQPKET